VVCKMATSCYGRISESGNRVTFVISAVRRTSAHQTLENGSTAEPLRHRQTKGAGTDMLSLTSLRHTSTLPIPAVRCAQILLKNSDFRVDHNSEDRWQP
jgi:hypothetical protein